MKVPGRFSEITDELFNQVASLILEEATQLADDAAKGGYSHDGGASELRTKICLIQEIRDDNIPDLLIPYIRKIARERDPEWQDYLRLKEKFED